MPLNATSTEELDGEELDIELDKLAALPIVTYDRTRKEHAFKLGISIKTLDKLIATRRKNLDGDKGRIGRKLEFRDFEPWDVPVDGPALADAISSTFVRHVSFQSEYHADTLAAWALHTHCLSATDFTPRLAITAPERECGKSTVLKVLGFFVRRGIKTGNISGPAIYRTITIGLPTLLIDEFDSFAKENEDIRNAVNEGHDRTGCVIKCVGDDSEPTKFDVFAPAAIASIGQLPPTIDSRSIPILMRRAMAADHVEALPRNADQYLPLARQCVRWGADHVETLRPADPVMPDGMYNRAADNWRPLVAIADALGGNWPTRIRKAAVILSARTGDDSQRVMLLADIRAIFEELNADKAFSAEIVAELAKMEGRPWPEYKNSKPITANQLARRLKDFKILPTSIRTGTGTGKGYHLAAFADAFARYLGGSNRHTVTTPQDQVVTPFPNRHMNTHKPPENGDIFQQNQRCHGVTVGEPSQGPDDDEAARRDAEEVAAIREDRQ